MRRPRDVGLNEIMIVNPSRMGDNGMRNRTNGHYGQPDDMGWYGMAGGIGHDDLGEELYGALSEEEMGAIPMDELEGDLGAYGAIPMDELGGISADELVDGFCTDCGGENLGYYTNDEDRELIGRYCPACSGEGMGEPGLGGLVGAGGPMLADDELTGLLGEGGEEALYGALLADDENYYGPPDEGMDGLYGSMADDLDDLDGGDLGVLGRYVREERPPSFNPEGEFPQLTGYERPQSVNAHAALERTVPASPLHRVPQIFRPHF